MNIATLTPSAAYLASIKHLPPQIDGNLTVAHGFLPSKVHTTPLGELHRAWEQAAAALPGLAFSNRAQAVLDELPVLPADSNHLPDGQVKWAATLLGTLAHAYWRFGLANLYQCRNRDISNHLPDAIKLPWEEVCRRLGRPFCGFTLEDQMFNNFTFEDPTLLGKCGEYQLSSVRTGDLRLLVPAYDNRTEHVFLCVFAEIHAALTPVVAAILELELLLTEGGPEAHSAVVGVIERIVDRVHAATRAFRKVSANPRSRTYCDPVEWAKTVVTFTVPAPGYPVGPSGSAAPLVHLLDALVGRTEYNSELGKFSATLRCSQLPRKQQTFFDIVHALDLRGWVLGLKAAGGNRFKETSEAFNDLIDAFAGPTGFLGVHKAKVVDYLGVGTLVGRNQSTAHQQTYVADRSWTAMADQLRITMHEREVRRVPRLGSGDARSVAP